MQGRTVYIIIMLNNLHSGRALGNTICMNYT